MTKTSTRMLSPSNALGIVGVTGVLGRMRLSVQSLMNRGYLPPEKVAAIDANGSTYYHRSDDMDSEGHAVEAVTTLLSQNGVDPAMIRFLVFTSTVFETTALYPDLVAQRIARRCGCINAQAFAIQHAYCASPFVALKVLHAYVAAESAGGEPISIVAVLVCSDTIGPVVEHLRAIDTLGVHSDGAAAILLATTGPRYRIGEVEINMMPARYRGQMADGAIAADPLFFACLAKTMKALVTSTGLRDLGAVQLCVNNLNLQAWRRIAALFGIPEQHLHFDSAAGHVFGADPFLNLGGLGQNGDSADHCILAASGIGGIFAAAHLERVSR